MSERKPRWPFVALGGAGLLGASGVALGAWSAHSLDAAVGTQAAALVRTALPWQMWHALALVAVALWRLSDPASPRRSLGMIALLFAAGTALFCGALYANAFAIAGPWRHLAPIGGFTLIGAWLLLALAAILRLGSR